MIKVISLVLLGILALLKDADADGVKNYVDCAPFDPARWQTLCYDSDGNGVADDGINPIAPVCWGSDPLPPDLLPC